MREMQNSFVVRRAIAAVAVGTTGIANGKLGKIIDLQGFNGLTFVIDYGTVTATNATVTPVMYEGDVTGTMTSVADADMVPISGGELAASLIAAATRTSGTTKNFATKLSYKGVKRYVQLRLYSTVTAGPPVGATALLFFPDVMPVTAQQAVAQ